MHTNDPSRFFHTLVVLGAALGAGCGGALDAPTDDDASATGGSAAGGSPAASGGSSGGTSAAGGNVATGGVLVEPPSETGWPFSTDCQTEQQSCDDSGCGGLPASPCLCEPERPLAASDCPSGQDFVCRAERVWVGDLDVEVRFGCSCVTRETACDCSNGRFVDGCDFDASPRTILCGGCYVILK